MTCREKWQKLNPDKDPSIIDKHGLCVNVQGIMHVPEDYCMHCYDTCSDCWDQKVPEEKTLEYEHTTEPIAKVDSIEESDGGLTVTATPVIKDSGDRTQFETGAVRDMRAGKGRCDLMPLEVVAECMPDPRAKSMLKQIGYFQKSNNTGYLVGCIGEFARHTGHECNWLGDACTLFLEVAKHFEDGALKYGENNWQKGIPVHCYIDSAIRHYLKWLRGDKDEPHDRAFVWNLMCCIWEVDYRDKENS
jgi:hypothetical protein